MVFKCPIGASSTIETYFKLAQFRLHHILDVSELAFFTGNDLY